MIRGDLKKPSQADLLDTVAEMSSGSRCRRRVRQQAQADPKGTALDRDGSGSDGAGVDLVNRAALLKK